MPLVSSVRSPQILILISDGGSPPVFAHPCMINTSRGIEFTSTTTEDVVPFCPFEDLPGWIERSTDSLAGTITGSGIFDAKTHERFQEWFHSGLERTIRVRLDVEANESPGYYFGQWLLSQYSINGPGRRDRATFDCTIVSSGEITWVHSTL